MPKIWNAPRDVPTSGNQSFASVPDYISFSRSVYEQHDLCSMINFAMHNVGPGQVTARTIKQNYKATIDRFVAGDKAFSFISSVKGTPAYWKQFSLFSCTLYYADLRW